MIPDNIENLIIALIEKTNLKKVNWGKTSSMNEFKLHLQSGAVTINTWWDNEQDEYVELSIYNTFGDRIDNFRALEGHSDYNVLIELHKSARREFYKVDETIQGLVEEIYSDKKIGERKVDPPPSADDLPF